MPPIRKLIVTAVATMFLPCFAWSAVYDLDPSHSFIQFKVSHIGIGWVVGRFNRFSGEFFYDPDAGEPAQSAAVVVSTNSLDSNHSERDRHLTGDDFLDVDQHEAATFVSTGFTGGRDDGKLSGILTLWGKESPIEIDVRLSGEGDDPWGGYRAGFEGTTVLDLTDFGFKSRLVKIVEVDVYLEGVRR